MREKFLKVMLTALLGLVTYGVTLQANAASLDQLKEDVNSDSAVIYSTFLSRDLTPQESKGYVSNLEILLKKNRALQITEAVEKLVLEKVIGLENVLKAEKENEARATIGNIFDGLLSRGASIPTKEYKLSGGKTYSSNEFSASGFRFSELYFTFKDYKNNEYFGVRVQKDSFDFIVRSGGSNKGIYPVYPDGKYHYFRNYGVYNGYFRTYNPIKGSTYQIN